MNKQTEATPVVAPVVLPRHGRAPTQEELAKIIAMHSLTRPHLSKSEAQWIAEHIATIPGVKHDPFGNYWVHQGESETLFSAHTDDVDTYSGRREVTCDSGVLKRRSRKKNKAKVLGADNAAGCWMLIEMFKAGVPGTYVWHRGEERMGLGSSYIADNHAEYIKKHYKRAVAFDRRGTTSVITHQWGGRCCSDEFGSALAVALNRKIETGSYTLDAHGMFTDTASYTHLIPECTNVSVGTSDEHRSTESLDLWHLCALRDACCALNWETLPAMRDPEAKEVDDVWGWDNEAPAKAPKKVNGGRSYGYGYSSPAEADWRLVNDLEACSDVQAIVEEYPGEVAALVEDYGCDAQYLREAIAQMWGI